MGSFLHTAAADPLGKLLRVQSDGVPDAEGKRMDPLWSPQGRNRQQVMGWMSPEIISCLVQVWSGEVTGEKLSRDLSRLSFLSWAAIGNV